MALSRVTRQASLCGCPGRPWLMASIYGPLGPNLNGSGNCLAVWLPAKAAPQGLRPAVMVSQLHPARRGSGPIGPGRLRSGRPGSGPIGSGW